MPLLESTRSVAEVLIADGESFATRAVERLDVTLEGIAGDRHFGFTRMSGGREPWYPRRTVMRNDRQLTLVSRSELNEIARRMDLPELKAEWIGANVVIDGLDGLTATAIGKRMIFSSGAVLILMGGNAPCRFAGASIARHFPERNGLDLLFPKVATGLRGLIAAVERAGEIAIGATVKVR